MRGQAGLRPKSQSENRLQLETELWHLNIYLAVVKVSVSKNHRVPFESTDFQRPESCFTLSRVQAWIFSVHAISFIGELS